MTPEMGKPCFLSRVVLENYKSIAHCQVHLGPLNFLVGPNGAGKSNFLDALRFVTEALRLSLDHALRDRGGILEVLRRSDEHAASCGIRLELTLSSGQRGLYAFRVGTRDSGGYFVEREECWLAPGTGFRVENGILLESSMPVAPAASSDRLYLVNASGLPDFRPLYDALSSMGFYSLSPDRVRDLQPPDLGDLLDRDGGNIASVLRQLEARSPQAKARIEEYLAKIASGIEHVEPRSIGSKETLGFEQQVSGRRPLSFLAANMSDGTLRALGVLVALFQSSNGSLRPVPLVAIEEPEAALHPAAAGVLLDALNEASRSTQILVTSHSPDLLENDRIPPESILAVTLSDGATRIGPLDEVGGSALRDHLYTPGELLRMNQLTPAPPAGQTAGLFDDLRQAVA
jgi:predicted ATPase